VKIIVVGGTGTIGSVVSSALESRHEVIRASPRSNAVVDINDQASISSLFERFEGVNAVIVCAQHATGAFGPLAELTDEQFQTAVNWTVAQVNFVRVALKHAEQHVMCASPAGNFHLLGGADGADHCCSQVSSPAA
jgi:nucleoside-diphosphate-sugar epimerase